MYQVKVREILVVFVEYNYSSRETLFKTKSGKSNACFSYFLLHRRVLESVWTRAQERALTVLSFKRVCFTFCFDIRAALSAFVHCSRASFGVSFVSFFFFGLSLHQNQRRASQKNQIPKSSHYRKENFSSQKSKQ